MAVSILPFFPFFTDDSAGEQTSCLVMFANSWQSMCAYAHGGMHVAGAQNSKIPPLERLILPCRCCLLVQLLCCRQVDGRQQLHGRLHLGCLGPPVHAHAGQLSGKSLTHASWPGEGKEHTVSKPAVFTHRLTKESKLELAGHRCRAAWQCCGPCRLPAPPARAHSHRCPCTWDAASPYFSSPPQGMARAPSMLLLDSMPFCCCKQCHCSFACSWATQ